MADNDEYIRNMHRLYATGGFFEHGKPVLNTNLPTNAGAGGLTNLFQANGWHLNMNEDRQWDVVCVNQSPYTCTVYRSKPFTDYWEIVSFIDVPAKTTKLVETFKADNEDQWWVMLYKDGSGKKIICDGGQNGSDAELSADSKSAGFGWHTPKPYHFFIRVSLHEPS